MPRVDFDGIVEGHQSIEQRVVEVSGQPARLICAEQIRATNGSDEQCIAGEDASWRLGSRTSSEMCSGVWPGVWSTSIAMSPARSVSPWAASWKGKRRAAPGPATTRAPRPRARGHRTRSRRECAFRSRSDRQAMSRCYRGVRVDVAPRVDDDGRACTLAGDEIRALRQAFVGKPFKHEVRSASGS